MSKESLKFLQRAAEIQNKKGVHTPQSVVHRRVGAGWKTVHGIVRAHRTCTMCKAQMRS